MNALCPELYLKLQQALLIATGTLVNYSQKTCEHYITLLSDRDIKTAAVDMWPHYHHHHFI